ncbi:hedgehog-like protein [Galdieria sulphuraria]|uniref:Hedgehog-like protein n=1 Tax=Galdieria sulphuraria TaxID=130081 RepID=M2X7X5_GALSU|nr:hedgehog-like protein [Galdieria sulphuraria]EME25932.1 hedgehog-like protein [Galdieria sulphuraria]|eukprot:XP_005702452.1 hedgehog-like protein [Galdieria sulphuraria]
MANIVSRYVVNKVTPFYPHYKPYICYQKGDNSFFYIPDQIESCTSDAKPTSTPPATASPTPIPTPSPSASPVPLSITIQKDQPDSSCSDPFQISVDLYNHSSSCLQNKIFSLQVSLCSGQEGNIFVQQSNTQVYVVPEGCGGSSKLQLCYLTSSQCLSIDSGSCQSLEAYQSFLSLGDYSMISASVSVQGPNCKSSSSSGLSCFPGSSQVITPEGPKPISLLRKGDLVLDVENSFTPVLGFLHRDPRQLSQFLTFQLKDGNFSVSPDHLVFSAGNFIFAKDIRLESYLQGVEQKERIRNVTIAKQVGVYAPLTKSGHLFVDGIYCSCYAHYPSHYFAHLAFWPWRLFGSKTLQYNGIMPYAKWLLENFSPSVKI